MNALGKIPWYLSAPRASDPLYPYLVVVAPDLGKLVELAH